LKNNKAYKYYFIAGEASGDLHGGYLMQNIKKIHPESLFFGVGGPTMEKEGLRSIVPIKKLAVLGFWEVFKKICFFLKLKKIIIKDILEKKPDKIVLIDYPGFNLKVAQAIKAICPVEIVYYVSPQLWAWKEKRVHLIKKHVDKMIVLFPFEKTWYAKHNYNVFYFGHPLLELHNNFLNSYEKKSFNADYVIALLPGSRGQELSHHLPLYKKIIAELNAHQKKIHYIVRLFDRSGVDVVAELGLNDSSYSIEKNSTFNAFHDCDFALVASGTATLEGAISKTPLAVVYKTSWFSWLLAKLFLKIPFVSIVNILASKKIVEEFLQHNAKPKLIVKHILKNLSGPTSPAIDYSDIYKVLDQKNIYKKSALEIIN